VSSKSNATPTTPRAPPAVILTHGTAQPTCYLPDVRARKARSDLRAGSASVHRRDLCELTAFASAATLVVLLAALQAGIVVPVGQAAGAARGHIKPHFPGAAQGITERAETSAARGAPEHSGVDERRGRSV